MTDYSKGTRTLSGSVSSDGKTMSLVYVSLGHSINDVSEEGGDSLELSNVPLQILSSGNIGGSQAGTEVGKYVPKFETWWRKNSGSISNVGTAKTSNPQAVKDSKLSVTFSFYTFAFR